MYVPFHFMPVDPSKCRQTLGGVQVFIHSYESKTVKTNNQPVKCCVHAKFAFIKVPKAALIGGGKETSPVKPRRPCAEMHPVRGSAVGQLKAAACPLLVPPQKGHCMIYAPVW